MDMDVDMDVGGTLIYVKGNDSFFPSPPGVGLNLQNGTAHALRTDALIQRGEHAKWPAGLWLV
jgi:hypothetical protein